jgi:hypothetical protein
MSQLAVPPELLPEPPPDPLSLPSGSLPALLLEQPIVLT